MKSLFTFFLLFVLLLGTGCGPKITPLQRKEAANLVSEAQFALTLRDWARAEELLAKATALCPDEGEYWLNLGTVRRRQDNVSGAKKAYEAAAKAFGAGYKAGERKDPQLLLQQLYVYVLLRSEKDAQKVLKQAQAEHPTHPAVRNFTEENIRQMMEAPTIKALAV